MFPSAAPSPYESAWSGTGYCPLEEASSDKAEEFDTRGRLTVIVFCLALVGVVSLTIFVVAGTMGADDSRGERVGVEVIGSEPFGGHGSVTIGSKGRTSTPKVTRTTRAPTTPAEFTTTPLPNGLEVAAKLIKNALNRSYAPCDDFYNFVCSTFSGRADAITNLHMNTQDDIMDMLTTMHIPPRFQRATEKAAGLFKACVNLASDPMNSQVGAVKAFLSKLRLDISDSDPDPNFDILHRLVFLSFVYGFPTFIDFSVFVNINKDRTIDLEINQADENWMETSHEQHSEQNLVLFYTNYLNIYDSNLDSASIVERILCAEAVVMDLLRTLRKQRFVPVRKTLDQLGDYTKGYVSNGEWVHLIGQATSNGYRAKDLIVLGDNAPALVVFLLDRKNITRDDSRLLIAWSLLHRLLLLANGQMMNSEATKIFGNHPDRVAYLCYETVMDRMSFAASQRYFSIHLPPSALAYVKRIAANVKRTLLQKLNETEWIQGALWCVMYEKAQLEGAMLAYPEAFGTESMLEDYFLDVPDTGGNFTAPYLSTRRVTTLNTFRKAVDVDFNTAHANAYYYREQNSIHITAGVLQPPVFIPGAPASVNYGGIGQIVGHEFMHAFDVKSIAQDSRIKRVRLENTTVKQLYTSKVLCLRSSYRQAESESRGRTLDTKIDSEGFVDFAGIQLAHATYRNLPDAERRAVVPDVGLTTDQTFFVSHCLKYCTSAPGTRRQPGGLYWHGRSRCIVPLRNMPQFAEAFSCKPGDRMNPVKKCSFW